MINKKTLLFAVGILIGGVIFYLYATGPVKTPSTNIEESASHVSGNGEAPNTVLYTISAEKSTAEFHIFEILRGKDFTAVGSTNQISGEILLNSDDVTLSKISAIKINARTLKTDDPKRDGAISRLILHSDLTDNEYIEFKPKSMTASAKNITAGQDISFELTGELVVSGKTHTETFAGKMKLTTDDNLEGTAETTVKRSNYGLIVPNFPFLASVADEVLLKISFTAEKK